MQSARSGAEFEIGVLAVGRFGAVPHAAAAVDALLAFEDGKIVGAQRDGLAGAHGDAGLFVAGGAEAQVAEDHVIGKAGHGLHFAAHQQGVLMRDQQAAVEGNLGPAARRHQRIMQRAAILEREFGCVFALEVLPGRHGAGDLLVRGLELAA